MCTTSVRFGLFVINLKRNMKYKDFFGFMFEPRRQQEIENANATSHISQDLFVNFSLSRRCRCCWSTLEPCDKITECRQRILDGKHSHSQNTARLVNFCPCQCYKCKFPYFPSCSRLKFFMCNGNQPKLFTFGSALCQSRGAMNANLERNLV